MNTFVHLTPPKNFKPFVEVWTCFCHVNNIILLVQKNEGKVAGGTWRTPGGKIESGETELDAIIREMKEETGIDISKKNIEYIKKVYVRSPKEERLPMGKILKIDFVLHIFTCTLPTYPVTITLSPREHQAYGWFRPQQALTLNLIPGNDEYIRLVYPNI